MAFFIIAAVFAFAFYLFLSMGSGTMLFFWSFEEIIIGAILSVLVGLVSSRVFSKLGIKANYRVLNPLRWLYFIVYLIGPFFFAMAKANLDVAYRVITGKIKPGIVKISPKLRSDFATTMLANSITLTPGTLTVEVDKNKDLYVHWINVKNKEPSIGEVCGSFPEWVRRISE